MAEAAEELARQCEVEEVGSVLAVVMVVEATAVVTVHRGVEDTGVVSEVVAQEASRHTRFRLRVERQDVRALIDLGTYLSGDSRMQQDAIGDNCITSCSNSRTGEGESGVVHQFQ